MDYTQLIDELTDGSLYGEGSSTCFGKMKEAATAIEALQAKVVELDHDTADLAMLADQYKAERDTLAAKLAALEKQEPVAWMVKFDAKLGGANVTDRLLIWRKDSATEHVAEHLIRSVEPIYRAAGAQPDTTAREYMTGYSDGKAWAEGQPAKPLDRCLRCNTPTKCGIYGCCPNTWPSEAAAKERT